MEGRSIRDVEEALLVQSFYREDDMSEVEIAALFGLDKSGVLRSIGLTQCKAMCGYTCSFQCLKIPSAILDMDRAVPLAELGKRLNVTLEQADQMVEDCTDQVDQGQENRESSEISSPPPGGGPLFVTMAPREPSRPPGPG